MVVEKIIIQDLQKVCFIYIIFHMSTYSDLDYQLQRFLRQDLNLFSIFFGILEDKFMIYLIKSLAWNVFYF